MTLTLTLTLTALGSWQRAPSFRAWDATQGQPSQPQDARAASSAAPERALPVRMLRPRASEVVHGSDHATLDAEVLLDDLLG